jgi:hypothetical protein
MLLRKEGTGKCKGEKKLIKEALMRLGVVVERQAERGKKKTE